MVLSGTPADCVKAFLGGLGISFTPCVFPLVPVILGYIGVKAGITRMRGFLLSMTYVTGVAVTYSILGLIASLTGSIFGTISSHPFAYIAAGTVTVFLAISMLDVFNLSLPIIVKVPLLKEKTYLSIFFLGLASGLIIGPCTAPALGAILIYLATKKNIVYGTALLLSFAYGMGLVLILAGTFGSILTNLPKSGKWMIYIKKLSAVVLILIGAYLIITGIRRI